MPRYHTAWPGLGLGRLYQSRENQALATPGLRAGGGRRHVLTKNGPRIVTAQTKGFVSSAASHSYRVQVPAGFLLHHRPIVIATRNDLHNPLLLTAQTYHSRRHNLLGQLSRLVSNIVASRHKASWQNSTPERDVLHHLKQSQREFLTNKPSHVKIYLDFKTISQEIGAGGCES